MKKKKIGLLLCLVVAGAAMFTGCSSAAQNLQASDNVADQALGQMIEQENPEEGDVNEYLTVLDVPETIPADCPLNIDGMKAAIENYVIETNKELAKDESSVEVNFIEKTVKNYTSAGEERALVVNYKVEITFKNVAITTVQNVEKEEQIALANNARYNTIVFNSVEQCFGYLYNRNQIDIFGNRTTFAGLTDRPNIVPVEPAPTPEVEE